MRNDRSSLLKITLFTVFIAIGTMLAGCGAELTDQEYVQRAKDFQDKGDIKASVIELKNALQRNSNNAEARWLLGTIYVELGFGAAAEKELRRALEVGVASEAIAIPLARALLLQEKFETLVGKPPVLQGLAPEKQAELQALHGHAYFAANRSKEADEAYSAALSIYGEAPEAIVGKAQLEFRDDKLGEARRWLKNALKVAPEFALAWSLLDSIRAVKI